MIHIIAKLDLIWAYFNVYNTNGSDARSGNLRCLHHKTNNLYENLQLLNWIWKNTNVKWYIKWFQQFSLIYENEQFIAKSFMLVFEIINQNRNCLHVLHRRMFLFLSAYYIICIVLFCQHTMIKLKVINWFHVLLKCRNIDKNIRIGDKLEIRAMCLSTVIFFKSMTTSEFI